jgi:hypothetical protein
MAVGAYGWQPFHFHVPIVLESGSLNFLEPSGPAQACNGIALPLHFTLDSVVSYLVSRQPIGPTSKGQAVQEE